MYVNVYLVDRAYGGPEEGGWWFETGEAIKSIPTSCPRVRERVKRRMQRVLDCWNEGRPSIDSVISQGRYMISIERTPAQNYPTHRPHYE